MKKNELLKNNRLLFVFLLLLSSQLAAQPEITPDHSISYNPFNSFDDCRSWPTEYVEGGYFYCGEWETELYDPFNGNSLNTELWDTKYKSDDPLFERLHTLEANSINLDQNVSVNNGVVVCEAKWEPVQWEGETRNISTGLIHSTKPFSMGYFEIRCKLPANAETPAAFWMWHHDEIDVIDSATKNWYTNQMISSPLRNSEKIFPNQGEDLSGSFHNYSAEWDPFSVTYKRDGIETATFYRYYDDEGKALQVKCGEMIPSGFYRVNPAYPKIKQRWYSPIASLHTNANATASDFPSTFTVDHVLVKERTLEKVSLYRTDANANNPTCVDPCEVSDGIWIHFGREQLNFFRLDNFDLSGTYTPNYTILDWEHSPNIQIVEQTPTGDAIKIAYTTVISDGSGGNAVATPFWVKAIVEGEDGASFEVHQDFGYFPAPEIVSCTKDPCSTIICVNTNGHCKEELEITFSNPNYGEVEQDNGMLCFKFEPTLECIETTVGFETCGGLETITESHHCPSYYTQAFHCGTGEPITQTNFLFESDLGIDFSVCYHEGAEVISAEIILGGGHLITSGNSATYHILPHQYDGPAEIRLGVEICGILFYQSYFLELREPFNGEGNERLYQVYPTPTTATFFVTPTSEAVPVKDERGNTVTRLPAPEYIELRDWSGTLLQMIDCKAQPSSTYQLQLGQQQDGLYQVSIKDENLEHPITYRVTKVGMN